MPCGIGAGVGPQRTHRGQDTWRLAVVVHAAAPGRRQPRGADLQHRLGAVGQQPQGQVGVDLLREAWRACDTWRGMVVVGLAAPGEALALTSWSEPRAGMICGLHAWRGFDTLAECWKPRNLEY